MAALEPGAGVEGDPWRMGWPALTVGETVSGRLGKDSELLDEGSYADYYVVYGEAGQRVVLEWHSADFDAFLIVFNDRGELAALDDDSAGGTNARVEMTFPVAGTYFVVVNAYWPASGGSYFLPLSDAAEPALDFDRAMQLIERPRRDAWLSDAELREAERLLEQLLELVRSRR